MTKIERDAPTVLAAAQAAQSLWDGLVARMTEDEDAWRLVPPVRTRQQQEDGAEILQLTDSAVQIDAYCEIAQAVELRIKMAANPGEAPHRAQAIEDWCRSQLDELALRRVRQGYGDLRYDVSYDLGLFGRLCPRLLLNSADPEACLFSLDLLDPRTVFPDTADGPPSVLYHCYSSSLSALEQHFGKRRIGRLRQRFGETGKPGDTSIACVGVYTATEMGVLAAGEWVRKPEAHGYGFCPILGPIIVGGSPHRGPRPESGTTHTTGLLGGPDYSGTTREDEWARHIGVSFIRAIRPVVEQMQKIATMQRELLRGAADPVSIAFTQDPSLINEVPKNPGDTAVLRQGDSYGRFPPDPTAHSSAMQLRTLGQSAIQAAGLNAALLGGGDAASGFDQFLLSAAGARHIKPYLVAQSRFWALLLRSCLRLFAQFGPLEGQGYLAPSRETGMLTRSTLTPLDVAGADVGLKVAFGRVGPMNLVQHGNLAMGLKRAGIGSDEYYLGELLEVDNPTAIMRQRRQNQIDDHPALNLMEGLYEILEAEPDPSRPLRQQMVARLLMLEEAKFSLLEAQTQMAAAGLNGPPDPNLQPPPEAMPPAMGAGAGLEPNQVMLGPEQVGAAMQPLPGAM